MMKIMLVMWGTVGILLGGTVTALGASGRPLSYAPLCYSYSRPDPAGCSLSNCTCWDSHHDGTCGSTSCTDTACACTSGGGTCPV